MVRFIHPSSPHLLIVVIMLFAFFVSPASAYLYRLAWDGDTTGAVVGYNVYRSEEGGEPVLLNVELVEDTVFLDEYIDEQTFYTYYVTSVNSYGVESDPSDPLEVYSGTYGDMNDDDLATAEDLVLLSHYLSANLDESSPAIALFRLVDMDDDFALDSVDLTMLLLYITDI
jgi:hypothetical protein